MKLNLGCGAVRPNGWVNVDSSLNAYLQKLPGGKFIASKLGMVQYDSNNVTYMNLNKPWKIKSNSADIVYASHLFEHLSLKSAKLFMNESYRVLKPGGIIRIVVPDLYKICKKYISEYEQTEGFANTTEYIMWAINMHREGQYPNVKGFKKIILEWQGYPHQHKFMYDEKSLGKIFADQGFTQIKSKVYGESDYIKEIKDVEGGKESYLSVYLEAKKPV
jgi:ubiquinone/menaquinone biosynthesis C-methylase UbiE